MQCSVRCDCYGSVQYFITRCLLFFCKRLETSCLSRDDRALFFIARIPAATRRTATHRTPRARGPSLLMTKVRDEAFSSSLRIRNPHRVQQLYCFHLHHDDDDADESRLPGRSTGFAPGEPQYGHLCANANGATSGRSGTRRSAE